MDLGNTTICKLTFYFYFQQESCKKINISVISRKAFDITPQRKILLESLNIGINAVFMTVNKELQNLLGIVSAEKSVSGMVGSHQS